MVSRPPRRSGRRPEAPVIPVTTALAAVPAAAAEPALPADTVAPVATAAPVAASAPPAYQHVTDAPKLRRDIQRHLHDPNAALDVLALIDQLCPSTPAHPDALVHWLGLLCQHGVRAQPWPEQPDVILIHPGHPAPTGPVDLLWLQLESPDVALVKAARGLG